MKKHLANIVSSSRIIGAFALFCLNDFTPLFLGIYVFCGFTDFIDGPIARKTKTSSTLGAALDTIGDVLTYLALVKILVIQNLIPTWAIIWLGACIVVGFVVAFISQGRFKKFYIPHTYLGKSLGGAIFVLPIAAKIMPINIWLIVILTTMSINLIECIYIQLRSKAPEDFVATVFHVNKAK